jgi:chemotaxis protein MotB
MAKTDRKGTGNRQNVIIKKEEIVEAAAHGGAWKVAYADFVTAMMAFFLLMWLLNATTEDQRKGLADYFSPNNMLSHASSGTGQPFGGHTAFDQGALVSDRGAVQAIVGSRPTPIDPSDPADDDQDQGASPPATPPPSEPVPGAAGLTPPPMNVAATSAQTNVAATSAQMNVAATSAQINVAATSAQMNVAATPAPMTGAVTPAQLNVAATSAPMTGGATSAQMKLASAPALATFGLPVETALSQSAQSSAAGAAQSRGATQVELRDAQQRQEKAEFNQAAQQIRDAVRGDPALADLARQLAIDITPQGLRIQILDEDHQPMFPLGSAVPNDRAKLLLQKVTPVLARLSQDISIAGHTDSAPFPGPDRTNWELSTERANATRRLLVEGGLPDSRIRSVTGNADRDPLLPADPLAAANRRIAIVVLRSARPAEAAPEPSSTAGGTAAAPGTAAVPVR